MFNSIPTADFSAFSAPVQKLVELNTAVITKAVEAQKAAVQSQAAQFQARVQAAMNIKDAAGFSAFITEQTELAKSSVTELTENSTVATAQIQAYFAEVQALLSETQDAVKTASATQAA
jgi:argonaute-like protein implicated in RNA metabolism and viral defense